MAKTLFRCLIPLTLIVVAGCSRGPVPDVSVVEVTPSTRSHMAVVDVAEVPGGSDIPARR